MIAIPALIEIATRSTHPKHRHAALVFSSGTLVGWANNRANHHAEVRALEVAAIYGHRKNLTLLSVAITKEGKLKLAKPCLRCQRYCSEHGVKVVLYSTAAQAIVRLANA